jgi:type II secretory pathway pseudopilin PulG
MQPFKEKDRAITLIELITTLIIIGILAGLTLPMFARTFERTRAREARAALQQIRTGERIYRSRENFYWQGAGNQSVNNNLHLYLDASANRNWDYSISAGATTFTATATRTDGGGTITIDQDGTFGGTFSP